MYINFRKYKRPELSQSQQAFLQIIIPYGITVRKWVLAKALDRGVPTRVGIRPSVLVADIIAGSEWGQHPVAGWPANNLTLLQVSEPWVKSKRPVFEFDGVSYRQYSNILECFLDLSDYYGWTGVIDNVLTYPDARRQIQEFMTIRSAIHAERMLNLIHDYGLDEFDLNGQED